NVYRQQFVAGGMRFAGTSPDGSLIEVVELPDHPWFIGVQYHPEFKSQPTKAHPLFAGFIGAAIRHHYAGQDKAAAQ
ncbi:MAG: gamma-glutamyl-gamma-aminobutyrate hydrolase family protein, partial [Planctomycetaceae bacterium]|nr:gamma-glutamyl-gamma-aminobutyrate hydrolase family protein [Planctomycetaceae bacterium]